MSPFLSRLACHILSLADKHGITLLPAYIPTHLNVEADFLSSGSPASKVAPSTSSGSGSFLSLGPSRGGPPGIFSFCSMPLLFHFGNSTASGVLGLNAFSHPWNFQVSYVLDGGSLASHSSQHAGRHSLAVSHRKRSRCGCLGRPSTQGSAVSAFNPLAAQRCVLCRQGFSSSVCQVVVGATRTSMLQVYQQCWRE